MAQSYRLPPVELSLSESTDESIQLFRAGTFHHPQYGKFEITPQMLSEIKKNFDNRVRGIDIAVDYKHDSEDVAAGWIKEIYLSDDGLSLWGKVEWTPNGKKVLSDREFRYISPEFTLKYQDNESLKDFGPVLLGAGLTNRPVIKKMEPIELSEMQKGDIEMQNGDMSPEQMKALIEELKAKLAAKEGEYEKMMGELSGMKEEKKMAEKKSAFTKLLSEGKVCKAQEEAYLANDMVKFAELAEVPKLKEEGTAGENKEEEVTYNNVDDEIHALAEALVTKEKISLDAAYSRVLSERKDLREKKYVN